MNHRLSEARIRGTCRELISKGGRVSGRALCAELRRRFGAVGKTERVFQIWREETTARGSQRRNHGSLGRLSRVAEASSNSGGGGRGESGAGGEGGVSGAGASG